MKHTMGCGMVVGYVLGILWVFYNAWMISGGVFLRLFPSGDENGFWAFVFRFFFSSAAGAVMFWAISILTAVTAAFFSWVGSLARR